MRSVTFSLKVISPGYEILNKNKMDSRIDLTKTISASNAELGYFNKKAIDKKMSKSTVAAAAAAEPTIRRYSGKSNAFLLELFAVHPDQDERYGFDMLEVTFEMFPDRDYCILCLPARQPPFPLLEHFTLVSPLTGKNNRFINESLYVAHINSVRGDLRVRHSEAADIDNLMNILYHARKSNVIMELFESSISTTNLESFVLLSENQPVGFAIVGPLENVTAIRTHYDLEQEPKWPNADGILLAGIMSPALEPHARWFLRELIRKTRYATLFWLVEPCATGESSPSRNLMSLTERMVPVRPRRMMPNMTGISGLDKIFKDVTCPFALWKMERPLTSLPKVNVTNGIVIVGASRTGLAFLEALITSPASNYLTFTNVTLVSTYGMPVVNEYLKAAETCVPREGRYTDQYLRRVPFTFYADIMAAVVVKIDRQKRCIHLKGGGIKYYDELVLCVGKQFQHPDYLKESLALASEIKKGKPCDRLLMDNPNYRPDKMPVSPDLPDNVMLINNLCQANICLRKLVKMMSESQELGSTNPIVVYGQCVEAYSCMAALLELGVMAWEIAFVEPFPSEDPHEMRINCFNDENVDTRVQDSLESLGITAYRSYRLSSWKIEGKNVVQIRLMSQRLCINLDCFALFYFGKKAINIDAFKAINESGLVYDGGLVVGPKFETNDPHIYAAGTCTQYSRRLYASSYKHRFYSSEDVGSALAELFLRKFDPFVAYNPDFSKCPSDLLPRYNSSLLEAYSHQSIPECARVDTSASRAWEPVMSFESPILVAATLPGPLYYMKMRKPGEDIPYTIQKILPHQGHTLETDKDSNYFMVQLNVLHVICAATCLSAAPFCVDVLSQLYGKHEAFFNKLLIRYQMMQIEDFFEFFMRPWMAAMYQENFDQLMNDINYHDVGKCTCEYEQPKPFLKPPTMVDKIEGAKGTFRDTIKQFIGPDMHRMPPRKPKPTLPTECGQNAFLRQKAKALWERLWGEKIVFSLISGHITRNSVTNPQYAPPKTNLPVGDVLDSEAGEEEEEKEEIY